ncbi:MAG: TolC family outer membrane protein [Sulfuricurvum sp.]|nr:TolC family outer membrane protein [Sulfuricurvum sp.]
MSSKLKLLRSVAFCAILASVSSHAQSITLSQAYSLALQHEPKLRSAALKTQATEELITQSRARLLPQIQGSLSYGYYGYEAQYLREPVKEDYSSYSISASQAIYHPEYWRGVEESQAHVKGAQYSYNAQAQQLGLDVAKAYFEFIRAHQNVDLSDSQKKYYETKYIQQEELLKVGLTNRIDLLEAKVHRDRAIFEWLTEQKRLNVSKLKLEHLVGESIEETVTFDFDTIPLEIFSMEKTVWEDKLGNNPSLKASEYASEMARHQVAMRQYEHYPKVDLSLTRKETYTKDTVSHQYDNQAIVQMSIPIYQGGYAQSKVREGLKLLDSATQDLDYTRKQTRLQLESFWAERSLMIEKIRVLRESQRSAELFVSSVEQGQVAGLKSFVDVLEARAKLYAVKRDLLDAGYELINNQLSLLDVTGELNSETLERFETLIMHLG